MANSPNFSLKPGSQGHINEVCPQHPLVESQLQPCARALPTRTAQGRQSRRRFDVVLEPKEAPNMVPPLMSAEVLKGPQRLAMSDAVSVEWSPVALAQRSQAQGLLSKGGRT